MQKCIKPIKSNSENITLQNMSISSKFSSFLLFINEMFVGMISEGLCNTEDWSNGCWKFCCAIAEIIYILKYIKIETSYFKL